MRVLCDIVIKEHDRYEYIVTTGADSYNDKYQNYILQHPKHNEQDFLIHLCDKGEAVKVDEYSIGDREVIGLVENSVEYTAEDPLYVQIMVKSFESGITSYLIYTVDLTADIFFGKLTKFKNSFSCDNSLIFLNNLVHQNMAMCWAYSLVEPQSDTSQMEFDPIENGKNNVERYIYVNNSLRILNDTVDND